MLHEVKGKLAKLLATENLIIEHRSVETAQFDVVRRVLTLPIWKFRSVDVYDLLVAHEVGHALFTDPRDWSKEDKWKGVPQNFVNITEDARIEKLMKRKYAGLSKSFYRGYSDLHDEDFFDIADEDLDTFSLADRINLHFKLGSRVKINFSAVEQGIVDAVDKAESFDDALEAARLMNDLIKQEYEVPETQQIPTPSQSGSTEQNKKEPVPPQEGDDGENKGNDGEESEQQTNPESSKEEDGGAKGKRDDTETRTAESLENKLKQMAQSEDLDLAYVTIPEISLDHVVIPASEIHEYAEGVWKDYYDRLEEDILPWYKDRTAHIETDYLKFKKDAAKEVNYLVKEFECRKSAAAYSRASVSRTGVLDCSKLHTYKFNEDLFKKVTVLPEGKNHGLVFVLDWSGSMADVLMSTLKQLYNLIWFCRKVGIPYDVYAFTSEWNYKSCRLSPIHKKEDTIHVADDFSMLNLLTSKVNNATAEQHMKNIWKLASSFRDHMGVTPPLLYLSGTPLNEAIISLHKILPDFKKRNGVEKVNCVILTDGEAQIPSRTVKLRRQWEEEDNIRNRRITENTFLRNRKTGEIRRLSSFYNEFTKTLLNDLKASFPGVNVIGFRIIASGTGCNSMLNQYVSSYDAKEKARSSWRKERTFTIKNVGYDSYFVLADSALDNSTEFEVKVDATKTQIRNAFKKSLGSKKMNKRVLNEFVALVA
jgi:hypothetical protein